MFAFILALLIVRGFAKGLAVAQKIAANAPMSNYAVIQALPRITELSKPQRRVLGVLIEKGFVINVSVSGFHTPSSSPLRIPQSLRLFVNSYTGFFSH